MWDFLVWTHLSFLAAHGNGTTFESLLYFAETTFVFSKDTFFYTYATNYTFVFTFKLACCLVFLSAIRGGVPRYRYDFLTKMGWVKFLGYVLTIFLGVFVLFLFW